MNRTVKSLLIRREFAGLFSECKRYAGHSKWANIKHTKASRDAERASLMNQYIHKMRVAVAEHGSAKPTENLRLAQLIECARKANLPLATINNFLERAASNNKNLQRAIYYVSGPGNCTFVVYASTSNAVQTKIELTSKMKKFGCKHGDSSLAGMFEHKSTITVLSDCDHDKAMEDAIELGAEDVQEDVEDDKKCFKFVCAPLLAPKIRTQLTSRGYNVVSVEEEHTPIVSVELSDENLELAAVARSKIMELAAVEKVDDNIA